jgi:hypothetical protein
MIPNLNRIPLTCAATASIALAFSGNVRATSLAFADPAGGWAYAYEGAAAAAGTYAAGAGVFDALDGTWDRKNGSDEWDGTGMGGVGAGNAPGGMEVQADGAASYLRIQDAGDARDHSGFGFATTDPTNRKLYPVHSLSANGIAAANVLDTGMTLTFRTRLATAATGAIDPQFPDTSNATSSENRLVAPNTPWQAGGNGMLNNNGGKGMFGIAQSGGGFIGFSLALTSDLRANGTVFGASGLVMNSLNGGAVSGAVDAWDSEGAQNVLGLAEPDLVNWHEFWVTIVADTSGGGTHRLEVYMDGSLTPSVFHVTAGNGAETDYAGLNILTMGSNGTDQQAAFDVDFFAAKQGIFVPIPEPHSAMLAIAAAGLAAFPGRRRKS